MKKKYKTPKITTTHLSMEQSIVVASTVLFGGNSNGLPEILDQEVEEREWEIEF